MTCSPSPHGRPLFAQPYDLLRQLSDCEPPFAVAASVRRVCAVALKRPVLWTRAMRWCGRAWRSTMPIEINSKSNRTPWNKGRLVGQKRPLRPKEVCAIRVRLQIKHNKRDLAMFNLAIDSKLRGCDLVSVRVDDIASGGHVRPSNDCPAQDGPSGSVRDHGTDPGLAARLVERAPGRSRPLRLPGPHPR